jgi:hypothetical protein
VFGDLLIAQIAMFLAPGAKTDCQALTLRAFGIGFGKCAHATRNEIALRFAFVWAWDWHKLFKIRF